MTKKEALEILNGVTYDMNELANAIHISDKSACVAIKSFIRTIDTIVAPALNTESTNADKKESKSITEAKIPSSRAIAFIMSGEFINAVKTYKEESGYGLKDAKDVMDFVRAVFRADPLSGLP